MKERVIEVTEEMASRIIEERAPRGLFVAKTGDWFIAIDNSTGDAWVEAFSTLDMCVEWLAWSDDDYE